MKSLLEQYQPRPIAEASTKTLADPDYQQGLLYCGRALQGVFDPVWQTKYLGQSQSRAASGL